MMASDLEHLLDRVSQGVEALRRRATAAAPAAEGAAVGGEIGLDLEALRVALRQSSQEGSELAACRQTVAASRLREAALEAAANVVLMTDRRGNISWVNPAFTRLTGYTVEEVLGQNPRFLKSGCHPPVFYQQLWRTILAGEVWRGEITNKRKDGSRFIEEATITPVRDAGGQITHFIAVKQDITERYRLESELREARERLEALFAASPVAIILMDTASRVRLWSPAAERIFGWSAAEVLGGEWPFPAAEDHGESRRRWERVQRGETIQGEQLTNRRRKDGVAVSLLLSAAPVWGPAGSITGILAMHLDITEKLDLESHLQRAQRLESIGHLASGIAHDLNNVLALIMLAAPLLRNQLSSPAGRSLLDTVEISSRRGAEIVKQVLTFARGTDTEKGPIQTRHLLREMAQMIQETFPKSIRLKTNLPRDLHLVNGNATQLHQVLLNLCINARDAMPHGGVLTLAAHNATLDPGFAQAHPEAKPGPHVVWTIVDTGIGIASESLGRIFDPYYTTKEAGKGTGLGLSNVRSIVTHHGGFIQVQSAVGQGACFEIHFPAIPDPPPAEAGPAEVALPCGQGEWILVVDDEENIRQPTRLTLEQYGYQVLLASDGFEGLTLFRWRQHDVRLVLTDVAMPRMSGLRLLEAIRQFAPEVRKVVMTGVADPATMAEVDRLQTDGFLAKPFDAARLLQTIRAALVAAPPKAQP